MEYDEASRKWPRSNRVLSTGIGSVAWLYRVSVCANCDAHRRQFAFQPAALRASEARFRAISESP